MASASGAPSPVPYCWGWPLANPSQPSLHGSLIHGCCAVLGHPPGTHAALCPRAGKTCFLCDLLPQKAIMPRQRSLPTSGIQMQACFPAGNHCISDAVSAARMAPAKQSGFPNAACRGLRLPDLLLLLVSHGGYMQPSVCRGP